MISLLFACHSTSFSISEQNCYTDVPQEGEVRIHSVSCNEEIGMFSSRGDWILENHAIRTVIRHSSSSMTNAKGGGGTLIEINETPIVLEIRPIEIPSPLQEEIEITESYARLSFSHDENILFSYVLHIDEEILWFESQQDFVMVLMPEAKVFGQTVYTNRTTLYIDGQIEQREQDWLISDLVSIEPFFWNHQQSSIDEKTIIDWPEDTVSSYALLTRGAGKEYLFPFEANHFEGYLPSQTQEWTLWHPQCSKNWTSINIPPELGSCEEQFVRVTSNNTPLWAQQNHEELVSPQGSWISQQDSSTISAGPAYEQEELSFEQEQITLTRIFPDVCIFSPFVQSAQPIPTMAKLLGNGIRNTVISTTDFISPFSFSHPSLIHQIHAQRGLLMKENDSWLLSWPWEPILREAGLGAIPTGIPKQTQLSYVDRNGRTSVSNMPFFFLLREETQSQHPDFVFIDTPNELHLMYDLLDAQEAIRFLGSLNMLPFDCNSPLLENTLLRSLLYQEHSFGNGPLVLLSSTNEEWIIDAYAPSWMSVETLALIGESGVTHATWDFTEQTHLSVTYPKTTEAWTLAEIRGEHWAISPIIFGE